MIKNVLNDIGGIGIYGVISICLFFAVFTGALVWSLLLKKSDLDSRSALPLEDGVRPSPAAETSGLGKELGSARSPKVPTASASGTVALRTIA